MRPLNYFTLGRERGTHWYFNCAPAIYAVDPNPNLAANLLAATSPRCGILDNLRRAIKRESPLPAHKPNIIRALNGEPLRGLKVSSFARALAGDLSAITIDIWIARAYNISEKPSKSEYQSLSRRITRAANRLNLPPRDYAASVWCGIILAHGRVPLNYGDALQILRKDTPQTS